MFARVRKRLRACFTRPKRIDYAKKHEQTLSGLRLDPGQRKQLVKLFSE